MLTSIYMSNSNVGIFFPDFEFAPENVVTGELEKLVRTTGEFFNSGVPKIIKIGWFTKEGNVENIFSVLDFIPAEEIIERFKIALPYRRIDIKQSSIEPQLINKLKKYNLPTDPKLIADIIYSLNGKSIDFKRLNLNSIGNPNNIFELLRCLGNVRKNKIILSKPRMNWEEDYQTFMGSKYLTEDEINNLREYMKEPNSPVRTIMETAYLANLVN